MEVVEYISTERLKTYEVLTDSLKKAVALHNHTLQLGSSLMSMIALIALIELSLRNSSNQALIRDFADDSWMLPGHLAFPLEPSEQQAISRAHSQAQKAAYSKLSYKAKSELDQRAFPDGKPPRTSHKVEVAKRLKLLEVSHGQVIAQTTLSFWKRLYSKDYQDTLWKVSLKRVFPNRALKRSDVSKALEIIYQTRNRVAHHEPVYGDRLESVMDAITAIRNSLGARHEGEDTNFKKFSRVHHLRLQLDFESFVEAWHTLT